jgi:hypothetical protein
MPAKKNRSKKMQTDWWIFLAKPNKETKQTWQKQ